MVESAPGVRLLLRATWQPGPREERPALVIVHGLGGSGRLVLRDLAPGRSRYARGWHVMRMNMRGAGDGEALCPLLYNAGLDADLLAAISAAVGARAAPRASSASRSAANLALLAAGRQREQLPAALRRRGRGLARRVDLATCADALERPATASTSTTSCGCWPRPTGGGTRRGPISSSAGRELGLRTVREYDERITAPFGGYESAAQYYERSSAGPWLAAIDRPDPAAGRGRRPDDPDRVRRALAAARPSVVTREIVPTGGHVGFVARSQAPGLFWAPERALAFLEPHVRHGLAVGAAAGSEA